MAKVTVTMNRDGWRRVVEQVAEPVRDRTVAAIRRRMPHRTGRLRASLFGSIRYTALSARVTVSTRRSRYALYVDQGTGIYGPGGVRIRPRRAQALRFVAGGRVVFATSVRGQRGQFFMINGLRDALRTF